MIEVPMKKMDVQQRKRCSASFIHNCVMNKGFNSMFNLIDQWTDNRSVEYGKRLRLAGGGCQLSEILKCTYLRGFAVDDFYYTALAQLPFPGHIQRGASVSFSATSHFLSQGEQPDCPSLRALREHILIVRPQRARRMVWLFPSLYFWNAQCFADHQGAGYDEQQG